MAESSAISWTDATWNPWQGCHKVSSGCRNCYMFRDKKRYGQEPGVVVRSAPSTFNLPLAKGKRHIPAGSFVFTCSWSDWFIEEADAWRDEAWEIIRKRPDLRFLVLTKRPERIADHLPWDWDQPHWRHVYLGVSAEDQATADERIPTLLAVHHAQAWVSLEPLLGAIDLRFLQNEIIEINALSGRCGVYRPHQQRCNRLVWVVAGGESGPHARPMHPDWPRALRDQCQEHGVPFHFKQWGEWAPGAEIEDTGQAPFGFHEGDDAGGARQYQWPHSGMNARLPGPGPNMYRVGKQAAGRLLDGREHNDMPIAEVPA